MKNKKNLQKLIVCTWEIRQGNRQHQTKLSRSIYLKYQICNGVVLLITVKKLLHGEKLLLLS
jgi:hypothetical protein